MGRGVHPGSSSRRLRGGRQDLLSSSRRWAVVVSSVTAGEVVGECRRPWPRQIITPILPSVKTLSLGGERLTLKVLDHYLHHHLVMLLLVWCFSLESEEVSRWSKTLLGKMWRSVTWRKKLCNLDACAYHYVLVSIVKSINFAYIVKSI